MLEIRNLTVKYRGTCALESVNFTITPGQLIGLVGPNGAGKTTLLKAMLGLLPYSSGNVKYNEGGFANQLAKVAYVPQRSQIDWNYPISVRNVVMLARTRHLKWWKKPSRQSQEIVKDALKRVNMWELRDRQIGQLSGGQQQRVFLARSLAQQAEVFFFDEPFNGVDVKTKDIILTIFKELKAENKILLVVSHDLGETLTYYDRLLLLNKQLIAVGSPQEVLTKTNFKKAYGHDLSLVSA
ncbi:MAG: metal ABC transporter ATP-binding protein [Oscillatoria sp. PMC 1051.18]|nr:metal ABC transporter ATP-binding protein [Oscillatoria sp. PMC 1050.18]MEC5029878.1 metal ABC transporter ATP-binding protein [Oscillatoria sp. PMC 1051.18]